MVETPRPDEYAPSFASYVARIADDEDVVAVLASQLIQVVARLAGIPEARGDTTPLPSFDDRAYVLEMRAGERTLADLTREWGDVRRATIALFRNLPAPAWRRRGVASDQPISVRALAYIIAGHVRHHVAVLDARYGE